MPVTRTLTLYTFNELSAEAQERAIERARESDWRSDWIGEMLREDMSLEFSQYFIPERLEPFGFDVLCRRYRTIGGNEKSEPALWWDTNPDSAAFEANVNLETFIRAKKLGRKYALALSAAKNGEIYAASVGAGDTRKCPIAEIELQHAWDVESNPERDARLAAQCDALEDELLRHYDDVCGEIVGFLQRTMEWRTSDEYYREELAENGSLFDAEGYPE